MTKKEERQQIFNKFGGRCAYCGEFLTTKWQVDHLIPVIRDMEWKLDPKHNIKRLVSTNKFTNPEMDVFENKMPSCAPCNNNKSSLSLENWRMLLEDKANVLERSNATFRMAKRYGLIKQFDFRIVFYFEKEVLKNG